MNVILFLTLSQVVAKDLLAILFPFFGKEDSGCMWSPSSSHAYHRSFETQATLFN